MNVSNSKDRIALNLISIDPDKVYVFPYGINNSQREKLNYWATRKRCKKNILFIGTFDYRKGCLDIVKIFDFVKKELKFFGNFEKISKNS